MSTRYTKEELEEYFLERREAKQVAKRIVNVRFTNGKLGL